MRFRVTTPNQQYQGKAAGVLFNEGQAIVDSDLPNGTGKPTEHVIIELQEFGYNIEPIDEEARFFLHGKPAETEEPEEELSITTATISAAAPKARRVVPKSKKV